MWLTHTYLKILPSQCQKYSKYLLFHKLRNSNQNWTENCNIYRDIKLLLFYFYQFSTELSIKLWLSTLTVFTRLSDLVTLIFLVFFPKKKWKRTNGRLSQDQSRVSDLSLAGWLKILNWKAHILRFSKDFLQILLKMCAFYTIEKQIKSATSLWK